MKHSGILLVGKKILVILVLVICTYANDSIMDHSEIKNLKYVKSVMKVYSQTLSWKQPTWRNVFKNQSSNAFIMEFIPKDQELKTYRDMFTIQGLQGLAQDKELGPKHIEFSLTNKINKISPSNVLFKELGNINISGHEGVIFLLGLKKIPKDITYGLPKGVSEIGLYLVIKGKKDFYILHRSWKREAITKDKLPFAKEEIQEWIRIFQQVQIN
ncbi:MAG: hypothetical protein ACNI22_06650 [Halarcobacter sp.]